MNVSYSRIVAVFIFSFILVSTPQNVNAEVGRSGQIVFNSAEEALAELKAACKAEDADRLIKLFGDQSEIFFKTGDPTGDKIALRRFSQRLDQRAELIAAYSEAYKNEQWYLVRFGIEGWNMHIPLVNRGKGWSFASEYASNADQRLRRAINEVATVDTLQALVKAQEAYFAKDRDDNGIYEYAQKFISTKGKQDGLYWSNEDGRDISPLDGIVARAIQDGYKLDSKQTPYSGYYYRILTEQGGKTRGGKRSYLKNGHLVDGFAILAYPVEWRSSGDYTFLVGKDGQVWKRDLGSKTESIASSMKSMELSSLWIRSDPNLGGKNSRSNW